ncbi:MAG: glutathione peroxidase [Gammaproteobacteria bacterium]|nr:glutathione peroxidase [Gammaproteobacteria bacterium]
MPSNYMIFLTITMLLGLPAAGVAAETSCPETLNFTKRTLAGNESVNLCREYLGKVVVVVNTASKCGYTYQYEGLEALYRKYKDQGLVVIGFPSNDFGGQEPGNEKQIQEFCRLTYGVEFPMFEKTHAARDDADPLYQTLGRLSGEYPQWNFHKYVLDRNGKLAASFNSKIEPQGSQMINTIEGLL